MTVNRRANLVHTSGRVIEDVEVVADSPHVGVKVVLAEGTVGVPIFRADGWSVEYIAPPLEEPTGKWAVVEDANGNGWAQLPGEFFWLELINTTGDRYPLTWVELVKGYGPLKVVFDGVVSE